jgi:hypothetical protein
LLHDQQPSVPVIGCTLVALAAHLDEAAATALCDSLGEWLE